jgi:threonine dehydratase
MPHSFDPLSIFPDVDAARALLARHFGPTPLVPALSLTTPGRHAFLKVETGLPTGSFKVRGAIYSLSVNAARQPIREVVAASTGNHGAAVAYAGTLLGIGATIFLPAAPNPVKTARIRELGARIIEGGADLSAAIDAAADYCEHAPAGSDRFFLHDATDPDIPAGAGAIGAEIIEQLPSVDAIYVPMGDTALIRGVASAAKRLKPSVRIVGVAARNAPVYAQAWRHSGVIETAPADTIADGLAVRRALAPNVAAIRALVDDVQLVSEEEMLDAIGWLMARERVSAEPAGAAATAAYLKELMVDARADEPHGDRASVLLITGCNIAPQVAKSVSAFLR